MWMLQDYSNDMIKEVTEENDSSESISAVSRKVSDDLGTGGFPMGGGSLKLPRIGGSTSASSGGYQMVIDDDSNAQGANEE